MPNLPIRRRPKLALWLFDRDLTFRQAAARLDCSHETVRRICLPFGDGARRVPSSDLMEKILALTGGEVGAPDFFEKSAAEALEGATGREDLAA